MVTSPVALRPPAGVGGDLVSRSNPRWTLRVTGAKADISALSPKGINGFPSGSMRNLGGGYGTSRLVSLNPSGDILSPKEVMLENMRLQKRIVSLHRNEKTLTKNNRELSSYLAELQKEDEVCRGNWEEEVRAVEAAFEARLKDLERSATRQRERLQSLEAPSRRTARTTRPRQQGLTKTDISAWFSTKTSIWYGWAEDYAHPDHRRLSNLDKTRERDICEKVKTFVRLTPDGGLPPELIGHQGTNPTQILLEGMLANFIVHEIIISPLWIFAALNVNRAEFISPDSSPISPVSRSQDPFTIGTRSSGMSFLEGLPSMPEIQRLHDLIVKAQGESDGVHLWRSQLMRALTEGGLSQDPMDVPKSKNMRRLIRARREHAKRLADDFLSGPACILLREQYDAAGIERMEWRLVNELDAALRMSAQIWSYQTSPLRVRGIEDFSTRCFDTDRTAMELCQGQLMELNIRGGDRHAVVAVMQPEIMAVGNGGAGADAERYFSHLDGGGDYHLGLGDGDGCGDDLEGIWNKAQVFVSARSVVAAEKAERRGGVGAGAGVAVARRW